MLEVYFRPIYQYYVVNPVARLLKRSSPDLITYLACLTGVMVMPAIMYAHSILAICFLLLSGYLDSLDGTLARLQKSENTRGSVLDIISDRIVELAVIFGLLMVDPAARSVAAFLMLGSCYICITCFLVVGIFQHNQSKKSFHYNPGLIERAEAFGFFVAMILFPAHFHGLAITFVVLVTLTSVLHIKQFMKFCQFDIAQGI